MKQPEHRFHHFTTFHIVVAILVASSLGLTNKHAVADELVPTVLSTDSTPVEPTLVQTQTQDAPIQQNPADSSTPASTEDLQSRLNSLSDRLSKNSETELDPIALLLPNISSNVPNAYGASQGMLALGAGFQNRIRYTDSHADGTVSAVLGLSDPRKLGADVQVSFLDLSRFGKRIALGFKLHRQLDNDLAVAVGGENALVSSYSDSSASYYAVISKKLRLAESSSDPFSRVYLSLGVGTGRFRSESDVFTDQGNINVFGSAAVNVNRSTMAFAEWTGQSLNVGTSIVPFRKHPFVVTLALADIAGSGGDGTRFTAGIGYVFSR